MLGIVHPYVGQKATVVAVSGRPSMQLPQGNERCPLAKGIGHCWHLSLRRVTSTWGVVIQNGYKELTWRDGQTLWVSLPRNSIWIPIKYVAS